MTVQMISGTNSTTVVSGPTTDTIMNEAINKGPVFAAAWQKVKEQTQNEIQNAWARGEQVPEEIVKKAFCDGRVINSYNQCICNSQEIQQQNILAALLNYMLQLQTLLVKLAKQQQQQQIIVINNGVKNTDDKKTVLSKSTDVSKLEEVYKEIDTDGEDGISKEEFVNYYVKEMERRKGIRFTSENDPELAKAEKEAENLFEALKDPEEDNITKERFDKIIKYYDKASDGKADGKYDIIYLMQDVEKIIKEGKDAKISGGKTLEENLEIEA